MTAKTKVTALASVTGKLSLKMPNSSHNKVPVANREYMDNEIPFVSFVRMVLMACGRKEMVVQQAATKPTSVV